MINALWGGPHRGLVRKKPTREEFIIRGASILTTAARARRPRRRHPCQRWRHRRRRSIHKLVLSEDHRRQKFHRCAGLVDTHWHMWTSLMRNMASNVAGRAYFPLTTAIGNCYEPANMYLATLLSAAEALSAGITTVHDWCHNIRTFDHATNAVRPIKLVPQSVLVSKTVEGRWRCGLGRNNNQHGAVATISTGAQSSAEDAFAILPDDLKNFKLIRTEP